MADAFLTSVGRELDDRGHRGGGSYRPRDDDRHSRRRSRSPGHRPRERHDDRREDFRDRGDRGRYDDRDRRGPPPRYDDRRGNGQGDRWGGGGGGGGGGGRGGRGGGGGGGGGFGGGGNGRRNENGVFGSPNIKRSATPEGCIPISKRPRKYTAWDVKAPGYESMTAVDAKMSGAFLLPGQTRPLASFGGVNFAGYQAMPPMPREGGFGMPGSLPPIHFKPAQGQAGPVAQTQSFARQARRLYVGNILHTADEKNVSEFFNEKMVEMNLVTTGLDDALGTMVSDNPVVAVQVNHEKNYAFVEFRNAEEATAAISFDGITFQGQQLKIRRPKDYTGMELATIGHIPGVVSTNVPDSPNKIFVGGLPSYLTEEQVMELLASFGELKSFNLVKDSSGGASKGFAFCEYLDGDVTDTACQGLNGMELGDRYLVVQRAQIGQNGGAASGGGASATHNVLAAANDGGAGATRVLQMLNMVQPEDLLDDQEYNDIVEDIRDECGKHGSVEDVKIPRPVKTEKGRLDVRGSESVQGLGKVYVLFTDVEKCTAAMNAIAGRQFAGRVIICAYAPEEIMVS